MGGTYNLKCQVNGCRSTGLDTQLSFHHIPIKKRENMLIWLGFCKTPIFRDATKYMIHSLRICSLHFDPSDYFIDGRLRPSRFPKRNPPVDFTIQLLSPECTPKTEPMEAEDNNEIRFAVGLIHNGNDEDAGFRTCKFYRHEAENLIIGPSSVKGANFVDSEMEQSGITLSSLSTLLEGDKKPWVTGTTVTGDVCVVCGDRASGRHYGAISCEGCKGFFKRSIRKQLGYSCRGTKQCEVTKHHRNRCQYCRLQKCLQMGMRSDSVQHERKPLSNNQGIKRESSEAALGSLSPNSMYNNVLDGSAFSSRSNYLVYDNSYQDDEESESANDSDSLERTVIAKAIETISSVISEAKDTEPSSLLSEVDKTNILPFSEEWTSFVLVVPTNIPNNGLVNLQYVCETASRLLFLSIHWVRSLPVFSVFDLDAQITMLKASWSDLFALGLVQCQTLLPLTSVVSANLMHLQTSCTSVKLTAMADYVSKLKFFIKSTLELNLDDIEFSALKAMAVFSPDRFAQIGPAVLAVEEVQVSVLNQLRQYLSDAREDWSDRLVKILLVLPQLRTIDSSVIEEVFFTNVLGNTLIESVIPYILRVESDDPFLSSLSSTGMENTTCENSNDEQRLVLTTNG